MFYPLVVKLQDATSFEPQHLIHIYVYHTINIRPNRIIRDAWLKIHDPQWFVQKYIRNHLCIHSYGC